MRQLKSKHLFVSPALELLERPFSQAPAYHYGKIINGTCGGGKIHPDSIHSLQASVQYCLKRPFLELHGTGLIALKLALGYSVQHNTNGLLLRLVSVLQKSKQLST